MIAYELGGEKVGRSQPWIWAIVSHEVKNMLNAAMLGD